MTVRIRDKKSIQGFTLIELLIVIVILGLLMSLVAPTMFSKVDSTKVKTAKAQMEMFRTALDTYYLDLNKYPNKLEDLRESNEPGWDGPYLPRALPKDPWGNDYVYDPVPTRDAPFSLQSYGKDGMPGGEDDAADLVYE